MWRVGGDLDGMGPLRRQADGPRQHRISRHSARRRDLMPSRVEVQVVRPGEHDHDARPAVVVEVLPLAGLHRDLQDPHLVILMQQAVVRRCRDERV